jgi:hypothetical protein
MNKKYQQIIEDHLKNLYANPRKELESTLPAEKKGNCYYFRMSLKLQNALT